MHDIAHDTRPGTIMCLDGRFYSCVSRLPVDRDRLNDIIVLQRIPLDDGPGPSTAIVLFASDLEDCELEGPAVLLGHQRPANKLLRLVDPRPPLPLRSEQSRVEESVAA